MPWTRCDATAASPTARRGCRSPTAHRARSVQAQDADADSVLNAARAFLRWRKAQPALVRRRHPLPRCARAGAGLRARRTGGQSLLVAFNLSAGRSSGRCRGTSTHAPIDDHGLVGPHRRRVQLRSLVSHAGVYAGATGDRRSVHANDRLRRCMRDRVARAMSATVALPACRVRRRTRRAALRRTRIRTRARDGGDVTPRDARAYWLDDTTLQWPGGLAATGRFGLYHSHGAAARKASRSSLGRRHPHPHPEARAGSAVERFRFVASGAVLRCRRTSTPRRCCATACCWSRGRRPAACSTPPTCSCRARSTSCMRRRRPATRTRRERRRRRDALPPLGADRARRRALPLRHGPRAPRPHCSRCSAMPPPARGRATSPVRLSGALLPLPRRRLRARHRPGAQPRHRSVFRRLTADCTRSYVADLDCAALKPDGWDDTRAGKRSPRRPTWSIYELHVRDFSRDDASVPRRASRQVPRLHRHRVRTACATCARWPRPA